MWPTDNTPWLLALGLVPLGWALYLVVRRGVAELVSLRVATVVLFWVGYHATPWREILAEAAWNRSILITNRIDEALFFSSLCMLLFLFAYRRPAPAWEGDVRGALPEVKTWWVVVGILVTFGLLIIRVDGLDQLWEADMVRGAGQWEREGAGSVRVAQGFRNYVAVLLNMTSLALALIGSVYLLQSRRARSYFWVGILALLVASMDRMWSFSRASGMALTLYVFIALWGHGRKMLFRSVVLLGLVWFMGSVGLNYRTRHPPGIGHFFESVSHRVALIFELESDVRERPSPNPLDATTTFTRKISVRAFDPTPTTSLAVAFATNIQPIPSFIFRPQPIGPSLTEVMGTTGSMGVTTPAMAEIYYVFGRWGALWMIPLAWAFAFFDRKARASPGAVTLLCLVMCLGSLALGLHSGVRPMTRPIVYAAGLIWTFGWLWPRLPIRGLRALGAPTTARG